MVKKVLLQEALPPVLLNYLLLNYHLDQLQVKVVVFFADLSHNRKHARLNLVQGQVTNRQNKLNDALQTHPLLHLLQVVAGQEDQEAHRPSQPEYLSINESNDRFHEVPVVEIQSADIDVYQI